MRPLQLSQRSFRAKSTRFSRLLLWTLPEFRIQIWLPRKEKDNEKRAASLYGEIYRATKQGDRFYIHEFSMGEFITVATGLMPEDDRRKAFLKESFESLQNGELVFVVFSTRTKANAIVTVKPLN